MKLTSFLTITLVLAFAFTSCDRDLGPAISDSPDLPSILSPEDGESYELTEDTADDVLFTIEWSRADFGYQAGIQYEIQLGATGDNFGNVSRLGTTYETSYELLVSQMNSTLRFRGFQAEEEAHVQIRVVAKLDGARDQEVHSEPISLYVTPYDVVIVFPELEVPGNYQEASNYGSNWAPGDENIARLFSFDDDDTYEGHVYIAENGSEFKFTQGGSWDVNWGDDGADGTLQTDGANIEGDAGYYRITVDLNELTYEVIPTEWGIVGDATPGGWDEDTVMEYDPDEHIWSITTDLAEGEMKFRANNDWSLNYGDNEGNLMLDWDGANIPVEEAGNYTITFDLNNAPFSYRFESN